MTAAICTNTQRRVQGQRAMEALLFVTEQPCRTLTLYPCLREAAGSFYATVLSEVKPRNSQQPYCSIRMIATAQLDMSPAKRLLDRPVFGSLGVIRVGEEDYLSVIVEATRLGVLDSHHVYRVGKVAFFSLSSSRHDELALFADSDALPISEDQSSSYRPTMVHPCAALSRLLATGSFYFSYNWDITRSIQRLTPDEPVCWDTCDRRFFWNRFLLQPFFRLCDQVPDEQRAALQQSGMFVVCIQGFVGLSNPIRNPEIGIAIVSRLSCMRAGTRYKSRGVDDDGHAANFVETEAIVCHPQFTFSYLILRGSVPLFWDQQGFQLGYPRIQLTRTPTATQPAFDRHFAMLVETYGLQYAIDLLSQKEGQAEQVLSNAFAYHIKQYPSQDQLKYTTFDVNSICKNSNFEKIDSLFYTISRDLQIFGYFLRDHTGKIVRNQKGTFRISCLDCLDRTSLVQISLVRKIVDLYVRSYILGLDSHFDSTGFFDTLNALWANNADGLSMIYTGTGALKSSVTRSGRRTISGFLDDVRKSAQRFYVNNFQDKDRQQTIELFLGRLNNQHHVILHNPVARMVEDEMLKRKELFVKTLPVFFQCLTWNTNSVVPFEGEDYRSLITIPKTMSAPNFLIVAFQEIVQLNPTQACAPPPA